MNRIGKVLSWLSGILVVMILFSILGDIVGVSFKYIDINYFLESSMSAGRKGGVYPIIVSTVVITALTVVFTVPLGLLVAIYLSKHFPKQSAFSGYVRSMVHVLSGVPSIVFGLFGNALFCVYFGMGFSLFSGALTLSCMALPLFISSVEKGISSIPNSILQTTKSLGLSLYTTYRSILIPISIPSIIAGLVLSIGRALAETAALIFTSGYVDRLPESIWDSGRTLSVHIYDLAMNVPGGDIGAYKSSFVLILLILFINSSFSIFAKAVFGKGNTV
ncbi:phosphate ABC transporter, permease protein PstA [Bacteriovorax sp. Seq25_V]|nr:phosphate ABC transporter, permease protein PstA [Bacteriovorax sp. Seq25_V]